MVSCQKGPTRHAYAWQIGPFWQDTLDVLVSPFLWLTEAKMKFVIKISFQELLVKQIPFNQDLQKDALRRKFLGSCKNFWGSFKNFSNFG